MKTTLRFGILLFLLVLSGSLAACTSGASSALADSSSKTPTVLPPPYVTFTLKTVTDGGKLAFAGVGGDLEAVINPDLMVQPGDTVRLVLQNGDGMPHDLFLPDFDVKLPVVRKIGDRSEAIFKVGEVQPGTYVYYCTFPGHRQAGQEGNLIVQGSQP